MAAARVRASGRGDACVVRIEQPEWIYRPPPKSLCSTKARSLCTYLGFTYYIDMNITLSLDDELVKKVRKIAVERHTTLTGIVRDYLEQLAAENAASGRKRRERDALERSFEQFQFQVGKRTWNARTYMPAPDFLDTHVYAYDAGDPLKQRVTLALHTAYISMTG